MEGNAKSYRFFYSLLRIVFGLFFRVKVTGRELIPDGAAVVCANHSSWCDPILVAFAFTKKHVLYSMAKQELFKSPIFARVLSKCCAFPVNRGQVDLSAIRNALHCLRSGNKLLIFPEGTRVGKDEVVEAKTGAVRIAEKAESPIVPVYVPRKKSIFRRNLIVIGEPVFVPKSRDGEKHDYRALASKLMGRIETLGSRTDNPSGAE